MALPALSVAFGMAFRALRLSPMRTVLSTLGVVVGVAALVAVLAVGDGVERFGREQLERTTDLQAVVISPVTTQMVDRQRVPRSDYPVFTADDASALRARLPSGSVVSAGTSGSAIWRQDSSRIRGILVQATDSVADGVLVSAELAETARLAVNSRIVLGSAELAVVG